eukprot:3037760-Rhodomonas_salina.2
MLTQNAANYRMRLCISTRRRRAHGCDLTSRARSGLLNAQYRSCAGRVHCQYRASHTACVGA